MTEKLTVEEAKELARKQRVERHEARRTRDAEMEDRLRHVLRKEKDE